MQNRQSNPTNLVSDGMNKNTDVGVISKGSIFDINFFSLHYFGSL